VERRLFLGCGREFWRNRYLGGRIVMEEISIETMLRFSKKKGVRDLRLKQNCIIATSRRCDIYIFCVKTCCNSDFMMLV
jgi:hypothetical protein